MEYQGIGPQGVERFLAAFREKQVFVLIMKK